MALSPSGGVSFPTIRPRRAKAIYLNPSNCGDNSINFLALDLPLRALRNAQSQDCRPPAAGPPQKSGPKIIDIQLAAQYLSADSFHPFSSRRASGPLQIPRRAAL